MAIQLPVYSLLFASSHKANPIIPASCGIEAEHLPEATVPAVEVGIVQLQLPVLQVLKLICCST